MLPTQVAIGLTLVFLFFLILYIRGKAALIIAINALLAKNPTGFNNSFESSRLFFWQLIWINVVTEVASGIVAMVIYLPVRYLFENASQSVAITFLVIGILIFLPVFIVASLTNILAPLFLIKYDLGLKQSLRRSLDLIQVQYQKLIIVALLLFLPQILLVLAAGPIVFLPDLPYHMIGFVGAILAGSILLFLNSILAVFQQTVWILVFSDLIRPEANTEEIIAMPEIVE